MLCRIASRDLLQRVVKKILLALNLLIMQELLLEVDWSYNCDYDRIVFV